MNNTCETVFQTQICSGRHDLINEIVLLCKDDGLFPNEKKLRDRLDAASTDDLERVYDTFYRFGAKDVLALMQKERRE